MKTIVNLFIIICLYNLIYIKCAQATQYSPIPTFICTNNQKDHNNKEINADPIFPTLENLINLVTDIAKETPPHNHWIFSSINYPNLKRLKIQKTNLETRSTSLATYTMEIPADNNSHSTTSIWGYHPYITKKNAPLINLTPSIATKLSQVFANNDTQSSRSLMPIIHCITTATFIYAPPNRIDRNHFSENNPILDNRYRNVPENHAQKDFMFDPIQK